jgi:hypothetical protein
MGWYYYLDDKITFPFQAKCKDKRNISPLKVGEEVKVLAMSSEVDCLSEMFVQIYLLEREFGVPLSQLEPVNVDEETQEAVEDWLYWVARGHTF